MKILYFGGQKSGKSKLAEAKSLKLSKNKKPYYIATYDNSYKDEEMQKRVLKHQNQRKEDFITIEEKYELFNVIKDEDTYLIDCMSMWLFNALEQESDEEKLINEIEKLSSKKANIVFVLNDINQGIIPLDKYSRKFVDLTGILGQKLASICDEVYEVKLGLERRLK